MWRIQGRARRPPNGTAPAGGSRGADTAQPTVERRGPRQGGATPRDRGPSGARTDRRRDRRPQPERPRSDVHAVQVPYVDAEGRSVTYTGQVNDRGVPHGEGSMKSDIDGGVVYGEWEDGRYRRGSDINEVGRKRGGSRTRSGSRKGERSRRPSVAHTRMVAVS